VRALLDENGFVVEEIADMKSLKWASYIPPTARVKSTMNGTFGADGKLAADAATKPSAGAFEATLGDLKGYIRGRVLPYLPLSQDFEALRCGNQHRGRKQPSPIRRCRGSGRGSSSRCARRTARNA
jgi:hypothetical protein